MIRNQWYAVLESKEVKKEHLLGVTRMGEKLVVWRDPNGKVSIISDQCPHLGASLSHGKHNGERVVCPFHGMEYDSSGQCKYVPALGKAGSVPKSMKTRAYPTYEANDLIWMWWGEGEPHPAQPGWFDIDGSFCYSGFSQHWPVHYSRMVENQLDVSHLPFVHANTIGRGNRTVVDGPIVKLQDDTLEVWVRNRVEDGTPPRKAEDLPAPNEPSMLTFIFPNIWQNRLGDDLRVVAVFSPIDEDNTRIYLRLYQRIARAPILRQVFGFFADMGNRTILNQDRRVVLTQQPRKTELKKMGEKLLPGDRAILTFRQRRHELKEKAGQFEREN